MRVSAPFLIAHIVKKVYKPPGIRGCREAVAPFSIAMDVGVLHFLALALPSTNAELAFGGPGRRFFEAVRPGVELLIPIF